MSIRALLVFLVNIKITILLTTRIVANANVGFPDNPCSHTIHPWKRHKGKPLTGKDEKTAIEFIEKYWKEIVDKWVSFFVYKKRVRCTDIKTKLK